MPRTPAQDAQGSQVPLAQKENQVSQEQKEKWEPRDSLGKQDHPVQKEWLETLVSQDQKEQKESLGFQKLWVFQRRSDGSVNFLRDWYSYKRGFGNQLTEFWLGNDNIHFLTSLGNCELRIDLRDFENNYYFAKYASFRILGESEKYKLVLGDFLGGNAGDSLSYHKDMPFSTTDQDNDMSSFNCAIAYKGAWWYNDCHYSNLNGMYWLGVHGSYADGINWKTGKEYHYSHKQTEMKFRPL